MFISPSHSRSLPLRRFLSLSLCCAGSLASKVTFRGVKGKLLDTRFVEGEAAFLAYVYPAIASESHAAVPSGAVCLPFISGNSSASSGLVFRLSRRRGTQFSTPHARRQLFPRVFCVGDVLV